VLGVQLAKPVGEGLRILCIGAHADDIEIGCGGTLLRLLRDRNDVSVRWVVFSGSAQRADEARCGAALFLRGAHERDIVIHDFRDGFLPYGGDAVKDVFEQLKQSPAPDVIFTHHSGDLHQDHRLLGELTWNTFRDHLVLEYEVPKYDGGLTTPSVFVALDDALRRQKTELLMQAFASQRDKRWFTPETFDGLMRLRGVESASPTGWAEGFHARKLPLRFTQEGRA
jgi:LmbE family N-acetylglucosaminyl deacetylase